MRVVLVILLALSLLALAPPGAQAQKSDPSELWQEFPLYPSPTPTATATAVASAVASSAREAAASDDGGAFSVLTISLMILAAGLGALAVTFIRGRRRSASKPPPVEDRARPPVRAKQPPLFEPRAQEPAEAEAEPAGGPSARRTTLRLKVERREPAESTPPAARPPPTARAQPGWQSCRIRLWRGYIKKQFYAEAPSGEWVAQSPFFRVEEGHEIEDSQRAAEALDALVDELTAAGWEVAERRAGTWDLALRRRSEAPRQPVN